MLINHGDIVLSGNLDQIKREFGHNRLVIGLGPDCQEPEQLLREHMADMIEVVGRRKDQVIAEMKEGWHKRTPPYRPSGSEADSGGIRQL